MGSQTEGSKPHNGSRGQREKSTKISVGGGVEHVSAVPHSPGVGHHVREGAMRTVADDSSALPFVVRPPEKQGPAHQCRAKVARQRHFTCNLPAGS